MMNHENVAVWSEIDEAALVINMHISLAPKANKTLSGAARQFGAERAGEILH